MSTNVIDRAISQSAMPARIHWANPSNTGPM
jgi:hypothetical protein